MGLGILVYTPVLALLVEELLHIRKLVGEYVFVYCKGKGEVNVKEGKVEKK